MTNDRRNHASRKMTAAQARWNREAARDLYSAEMDSASRWLRAWSEAVRLYESKRQAALTRAAERRENGNPFSWGSR